MGNHRFKFSDMMPNTWFYKLKDMSKTKNHKTPFSSTSSKSQFSQPRSSFSYTRKSIRVDKIYNSHAAYTFLDPPRKSSSSSKKKSKRKTIYKPSPKHIPSSITSSNNNYASVSNKLGSASSVSSTEDDKFPELDFLNSPSSDLPNSCSCHFTSSSTDIIIDVNDIARSNIFNNIDTAYAEISELDQLPPILTKQSSSIKNIKQDDNAKPRREKEPTNKVGSPVSRKHYLSNSSGVRLRTNSTKIASKRNSVSSKRRSKAKKEKCSTSTGTSFAIVKASIDPEKDFRESMIEMVVENNIRASKDLENLLACYLSLNSNEYHDLIIKAFEQVWFDLSDLHL
ncbi:transcription repressor OFP3 [Capsicum chacoense]|uniref:transcription repressor OFP3 n=1 Tax=Capsicum annuum TaxID=4072 RepID=UPI0007BF3E1C|nr:transcription repressor OFP3 [Capsicum annuum]KAF3666741.1 putative serine/threonine-protein kinase WNK4-like [Capsicum annuum]